MELKTKIEATENRQEILITRSFDLPVNLLFKAYTEAELFEQWMNTKVFKFDMQKHGCYQFKTSHNGQLMFSANGAIHDIILNKKIIRTFEMENTPFPPQIEFLEFEKINDGSSQLNILTVFKSLYYRDEMLKLPFVQGLNMAHNRLQAMFSIN
jgi:uncharacterized protein YndB with AHSA1/START domain